MNPKQYICTAFLNLTKEKSFDKITVKNIIERASVSRSTFYNHFSDKYEIIEWYFTDQAKKIFQQIDSMDGWYNISLHLNIFAEENKFIFKTLYLKDSSKMYHLHFAAITYDYVKKYCLAAASTKELSVKQHLEVLFIAEGTQKLIHEWLVKDLPLSAKEITDISYQLIPEYIREQMEKTTDV